MAGICKLCNEPLTNFICLNKFSEQIESWLPEKDAIEFASFNHHLLENFDICTHSGCNEKVICTERQKSNLCAFCYLYEVMRWLKARSPHRGAAFARTFSAFL